VKIIIIGAGIMGLSCALQLARQSRLTGTTPCQILVLDSRASGQGASTAALGALWPPSPLITGPLQSLHRQSLAEFESFVSDLAKQSSLPISFRRGGRFEFLSGAKAIARAVEEAAASPNLELLNESQVAALLPGLGLHQPALHCRATAQVNVHELITALRAACINAAIEIREHTPVLSLAHDGPHIKTVHTARETIATDTVLITAGAWSAQLSPILKTSAPVRPAKGQGLALRRPPNVHFTAILKSGPIYLVPWDSEILVGSTTELQAAFDESPTPAARELLLAGAAAILPALKNAPILRHWAGLRPQNPAKGHPPIMGPHPSIQNLFLCTAHFKTGIGMAPLVSHLMARAILEGSPPTELSPFLPRG
jgi:glycine oxidase